MKFWERKIVRSGPQKHTISVIYCIKYSGNMLFSFTVAESGFQLSVESNQAIGFGFTIVWYWLCSLLGV